MGTCGASLRHTLRATFGRANRQSCRFVVRVKCNGCRDEHLVAFSCKRRGFCPSCGARRMIETSAHLVDHVFPEVPVRQWVLSFPWPLRLLFASQPDALGRCLSVIIRATQTNLAHRAGLTASAGARTGVVTLIQRFGSALNLNIHLHMLILDGVYTMEQNGPRFHRVVAPDPQTLERLLNRLVQRIVRRLTRDGLLIQDPDQPWLNLEPSDSLDQLNAASIRYRITVGQGAGGRTLTLKNPFRDGTTHILFSPQDFVARLAALVPRPWVNLTRYHGVFAPSSPMRRAIVPTPARARQKRKSKNPATAQATREQQPAATPTDSADPPTAPLTWAQRLKRVFDIDINLCPLCGGQLRVIADITDPDLIRKILDHVQKRAPPGLPPRRAPSDTTYSDLFAKRQ
jgi:hypothetical protein